MSRVNGHDARINSVLGVAFQREGLTPVSMPVSFEDIFESKAENDEEAMRIRMEAVMRMLDFLFQDGCHPGHVMRLLYLLTQRVRPELILNMSGAELADMFGETRAAWSARMGRTFNGYLQARGAKAVKGRMQKSDSACAAMAQAARGNTNRRGKTKRAA